MAEASLTIGIVAGEKSGDALGAGLMREVKKKYPDARFSGIGGEAMIAEGFHSLAPMERLSVMGLIEPLKRLPELVRIRRRLYQHFIHQRPDIFLGIDSPDFNLGLARKLKKKGITTCHYVCPSVWAWRQGRVKKIAASVDHVLALLPFEADFLRDYGIQATFVGHPLADKISREYEGQNKGNPLRNTTSLRLCIMPGSRSSEVNALLDTFLAAAAICIAECDGLEVVIPAATEEIAKLITGRLEKDDMQQARQKISLRESFVHGQSLDVMRQADIILLASGTATLEAALLQKPMVVAYKMSALGYAIARRMVKVEHIALPNLLLKDRIVPELIQDSASSRALADEVLRYLNDPAAREKTQLALAGLAAMLARQADVMAANAVVALTDHHDSSD